jgi:phosphohistidine phosphatase
MLTVLLLRHAKSRWDEPGLADHDRGLAPRGEKAARRIGIALAERGWRPDLVLCSTARRTRDTWDLVEAALPPPAPELKLLKSLYLATPSAMLTILRRQPDGHRCVVLVGHNPGMHGLAVSLAGGSATPKLREKYPTGALARLDFAVEAWRDLAPGAGHLVEYVRPRELG